MNLYPQDLREELHVNVLWRRNSLIGAQMPSTIMRPEIAPHLGMLGRAWWRELPISQQQAATFNAADGAVIDRVSLSHLAESARRVAAISVSAANARAELDSYQLLNIRQTALAADEPLVQNLQRTIK